MESCTGKTYSSIGVYMHHQYLISWKNRARVNQQLIHIKCCKSHRQSPIFFFVQFQELTQEIKSIDDRRGFSSCTHTHTHRYDIYLYIEVASERRHEATREGIRCRAQYRVPCIQLYSPLLALLGHELAVQKKKKMQSIYVTESMYCLAPPGRSFPCSCSN